MFFLWGDLHLPQESYTNWCFQREHNSSQSKKLTSTELQGCVWPQLQPQSFSPQLFLQQTCTYEIRLGNSIYWHEKAVVTKDQSKWKKLNSQNKCICYQTSITDPLEQTKNKDESISTHIFYRSPCSSLPILDSHRTEGTVKFLNCI